MALLRAMFGNGVEKVIESIRFDMQLRVEKREFKVITSMKSDSQTPSQKTVEITAVVSNYHIELNPSDVGLYDYVVVQEIIKEIAQYKQLDASAKHPYKGIRCIEYVSVVVVLNEVDNLSRNAQAGLRRTMEKYTGSCRLILCCENSGRIIPPIRSRCLCIRVAAPTPLEVWFLGYESSVDHDHIETELSEGESSSCGRTASTDRPSERMG